MNWRFGMIITCRSKFIDLGGADVDALHRAHRRPDRDHVPDPDRAFEEEDQAGDEVRDDLLQAEARSRRTTAASTTPRLVKLNFSVRSGRGVGEEEDDVLRDRDDHVARARVRPLHPGEEQHLVERAAGAGSRSGRRRSRGGQTSTSQSVTCGNFGMLNEPKKASRLLPRPQNRASITTATTSIVTPAKRESCSNTSLPFSNASFAETSFRLRCRTRFAACWTVDVRRL